jgi:glycosyltransferase involved in cell wall biosynthesis
MNILVLQESDWLKRNPHQQHHLMERLAVRGHIIRVIDYDIEWKKARNQGIYTGRAVFKGIDKTKIGGNVTVIRPGCVHIPFLHYLYLWITHRQEIIRQINEFHPEVMVGFGIINTYIASKFARKYRIPFVYYWIDTLDDLIEEKLFRSVGKFFEKKALANAHLILCINRQLQKYLITMGAEREKTKVISAGIDLEKFNLQTDRMEVRNLYGLKNDDVVFFFMGWLYHFSGLKEVAVHMIEGQKKYSNAKLVIVGDGDAYGDLKEIQEYFHAENSLILTGKQPYDKIPSYIAASDVCILPAYPDEIIMQNIVPIKIYEYLAMQKPVITTRLPGIIEEFGSDHGVIYVDRPEDVIDRAMELHHQGQIELEGKKGRIFIEKYDWNVIVDEFERDLQHLVHNP